MLEFALGVTLGQQGATRSASVARSMAVGDSTRHANLVEDLNERVERLLVIIQAMWALMEEQGMSEELLLAKINEIRESNPTLGGRARAIPADCPECGSKVAVGLAKCQICGAEVMSPDAGPLDIL